MGKSDLATIPTSSQAASRLSIQYLLAVTAAVGVAIAIARGIEILRFPADQHFYKLETPIELGADDFMIAAIYGICLVTFLFAYRSGDFWNSPGKTLSLLFATMCVLNWTLDAVAALVVQVRLATHIEPGTEDFRWAILGRDYRDFAPTYGYVLAIPILLLAVFKSKHQGLSWRLVWVGFLIFDLLIVGYMHFDFGKQLPFQVNQYYFEYAMGIPILLLTWAMIVTITRRKPMDWWTLSLSSLIIAGWAIGTTIRMAS